MMMLISIPLIELTEIYCMKNNKLLAIGDVLIVRVNSQISGGVRLSSYTDSLTGLTDERNVKREFRITSDDIFWTDWKNLTNQNLLESGESNADGSFIIEVRYTRTGSDDTGEIEFNSIDFSGDVEPKTFVAPTINESMFSDTINEPELKNLEKNIFKKLYYRGILPQYIIRAENSDLNEDKDFVDLWTSVAKFFGLFISFFKRYENFNNDYSLLYEYVKQNGLYFDESKVTLEELQYLSQHFYDQIRQRGTNMIFKRKGDILPDGSEVPIDGEFIRLMRSKIYDELKYEVIPLDKMGWCLGNSSPLYKGTSNSKFLNKTKEDTEDFKNLDNFVLNKSGNSSYTLSQYDGKNVLMLRANGGGVVGLGRIDEEQDVTENLYVADSKMDYEITFAFRIISNPSGNSHIKFGVEGFDSSKNKLNDAFVVPSGGSISEMFFDTTTENKRRDCWYYARGIIHAYSTQTIEGNSHTNLGYGNNLYFNSSFVRYILPKIQIEGDSDTQIAIWNYKIRPLVRGTNILPLKDSPENAVSLGFIQSSRIFFLYVKNNNNSLSQQELDDIVNRYLLPFNLNTIFVYINNF